MKGDSFGVSSAARRAEQREVRGGGESCGVFRNKKTLVANQNGFGLTKTILNAVAGAECTAFIALQIIRGCRVLAVGAAGVLY